MIMKAQSGTYWGYVCLVALFAGCFGIAAGTGAWVVAFALLACSAVFVVLAAMEGR
jgi:hypothetical protein